MEDPLREVVEHPEILLTDTCPRDIVATEVTPVTRIQHPNPLDLLTSLNDNRDIKRFFLIDLTDVDSDIPKRTRSILLIALDPLLNIGVMAEFCQSRLYEGVSPSIGVELACPPLRGGWHSGIIGLLQLTTCEQEEKHPTE